MDLSWQETVSRFHIASARDILSLECMERHQNIRRRFAWMTGENPPVALLFISHRWQSTEHPDEDGLQLRAIQILLGNILDCIEAAFANRADRLSFVPSLTVEGRLQAQEIARRVLGYGPFAGKASSARKDLIVTRYRRFDGDSAAFRDWLAGRVGVWLDYTCMPQRPLTDSEAVEFRRALGSLDRLVAASTVIALRESPDDYATRGWCSSEYLLGSRGAKQISFSKALFVDVGRLTRKEDVPLPAEPSATSRAVLDVMQEGYRSDLDALNEQVSAWTTHDGPFVDATMPDPWTYYRSLQGSAFKGVADDPNPFRRALEVIRTLESSLVHDWLLGDRAVTWDVGARIDSALAKYELRCTDPADLTYLGFLLASNGWIDAFKPLFRACLDRYLASAHRVRDFRITLHPPAEHLSRLLKQANPCTPDSWRSRLSEKSQLPREAELVARVEQALQQHPPRFEFG